MAELEDSEGTTSHLEEVEADVAATMDEFEATQTLSQRARSMTNKDTRHRLAGTDLLKATKEKALRTQTIR